MIFSVMLSVNSILLWGGVPGWRTQLNTHKNDGNFNQYHLSSLNFLFFILYPGYTMFQIHKVEEIKKNHPHPHPATKKKKKNTCFGEINEY